MRRDYDVFEKFPDGSTLWRAFVSGRYEAQRKMQQLAEISAHEFFVIEVQAVELLPSSLARNNSRPPAKRAAAVG
jgi:hypothetical protein